MPEYPRGPEHRDGFRLVFAEDFDSPELNLQRWSPQYLPHWSGVPLEARFTIDESRLRLRVDPDQLPWCPDHDGTVRVSALQTGQFSGPAGTHLGQHRFRTDLIVRRVSPTKRLYVPCRGYLQTRIRAQLTRADLISLYLIGFEDVPQNSGEITVFEIFGSKISSDGVVVGRGIKAIHDPRLTNEFWESPFPLKLSDWHEFAIDWHAGGVEFFLDGTRIGRTSQSPNYPMQLMLTCYRLEDGPGLDAGPTLEVDYVFGYEHVFRDSPEK